MAALNLKFMPPPIDINDLNEKKGVGWLTVTSWKMLGKDPKSYIILVMLGFLIYFIWLSNKRSDQIVRMQDELYERMIQEIRPIQQQVNDVKDQVDTTAATVKAAVQQINKQTEKEDKK